MLPFRLACRAMKCRFELVLFGSVKHLRAIAQEALDEVRALDEQLSFFSPRSEITAINRRAARRAVPVEPRLFELLCRCREIWELTEGAFDPTVGPLMEIWGWTRREGRLPQDEEIRQALCCVGMQRVELDPARRRVRFERQGMSLNLGSVGKGYALDRAAEILREHGIDRALIHGGTSSVCALGSPPGDSAWRIDLEDPRQSGHSLASIPLCDQCLGVSGRHLQTLELDGQRYGHVLEPASGRPADAALLTAVVSGSCADADAFSTALLCRPNSRPDWKDEVQELRIVN